jgi:dimethylaniline monooxygenase (N-oxide forming)
MRKLRIGIIGAGASGMTATKACLEEGFDVVVYEKTNFTGGLWRYHDEDIDGIASVMKSTISNGSKEMSAFSDFPPPPQFPNYLHNIKMVNEFYLLIFFFLKGYYFDILYYYSSIYCEIENFFHV